MLGNLFQDRDGKEGGVFSISNIQIISEKIGLNEEMFSMVKYTFDFQQIMFIWVTVCAYVPEDLDFVQCLIEKILIVGDHFEASIFLVDEIEYL